VIGENDGQGERHSDLRCKLSPQAVSGAKVFDGRHAFPVAVVAAIEDARFFVDAFRKQAEVSFHSVYLISVHARVWRHVRDSSAAMLHFNAFVSAREAISSATISRPSIVTAEAIFAAITFLVRARVAPFDTRGHLTCFLLVSSVWYSELKTGRLNRIRGHAY